MSAEVEIGIDASRWARVEARYLTGQMRVLTACVAMTEEAMDVGVDVARKNIQHEVYDAYQPASYQRSFKLLNSVKKRRLGLGTASGSIFVSSAVLNENPSNTRGIYYALPVDQNVGANQINPGGIPGPRPFWRMTLAELRATYFGVVGPRYQRLIRNAFKEA